MSDGKVMRVTLPEGGEVFMRWPDDITLESLEMVSEILALQLKSVSRAIVRKTVAADYSAITWMDENGYPKAQPDQPSQEVEK